MARYWSLLKKELRTSRMGFFILLFSIVAWDVFLSTRSNSWDKTLIFVLSFVPVVVLPFYAFVSGFSSFREEWQDKTIYLLLSLPVRGITLTSVKLLSVFIEILVFVTIIFIGVMMFGQKAFPVTMPYQLLIQGGLILSIAMLMLATMSQFAYLAGRLFERFQWLVSLWVFILLWWGIGRLFSLFSYLLKWLPDIQVKSWQISGIWDYLGEGTVPPTFSIHSAALVAVILSYLIIFLLGSWFLEKYAEI